MSAGEVSDDFKAAQVHHKAGRLTEAEAKYRQVLRLQPGHAAAVQGLGVINHQIGRHQEAVLLLQQAVTGAPQVAEFRVNLAAVLGRMGRHAEAVVELREAVKVNPSYVQAWLNLGVALEECGKPQEAVEAHKRAIALRPSLARAHHLLGNALRRTGRWREAEAAQREAIRLAPNDPSAYSGLATTLSGLGWLDEVIACRRKVVQFRPKFAPAGSALLTTLHYSHTVDPQELLLEARAWAGRHAQKFRGQALQFQNDRSIDRRLRVGFVSANVSAHPEGRFLRPMLAHLGRGQFESFVYSATSRADGMTANIKHLCDQWREIGNLADSKAAQLIRDDRIDILVELTGHFGNSRMLLFARRPAPVQVIHFGYPGTSGLETMDWRLTDPVADPLEPSSGGGMPYTTERLWRLPNFAWCYEPPLEARSVAPRTSGGEIKFVCVNNTIKLNTEAVAVWAQILREVPGSRLELLAEGGRRTAGGDDRGQYLQEVFSRQGIQSDRVTLVPRQSRARYFEWIHSVDIALDPFPYNGGVTTCDTLWMGVPVIAMEGNTYWSRQGKAILSQIGLQELCAGSKEQYVRIAVDLAKDASRLAAIRGSLRSRLRAAPVMDCVAFGNDLGKALQEMWRQWCAKKFNGDETTP